MKTCPRCQIEKPMMQFKSEKAIKECLPPNKSYCKECTRDYAKKRTALAYATVRNIKTKLPCRDCGKYYPFWVMQFDHVRGEKKFIISSGMGKSIEAIMEEISKCDVVCANCHANRTYHTLYVDGPLETHFGQDKPIRDYLVS